MGQGFNQCELNGGRSFYVVGTPVRARPIHEGIGDALRTAFEEPELSGHGAACEFERLLAKL